MFDWTAFMWGMAAGSSVTGAIGIWCMLSIKRSVDKLTRR